MKMYNEGRRTMLVAFKRYPFASGLYYAKSLNTAQAEVYN